MRCRLHSQSSRLVRSQVRTETMVGKVRTNSVRNSVRREIVKRNCEPNRLDWAGFHGKATRISVSKPHGMLSVIRGLAGVG